MTEIDMTSDGGMSRDSDNLAWQGHPVVQEITRRKTILRTEVSQTDYSQAKLGLVVEGGAMRGVYSAGALVALEQLGLRDVFDAVYAESAGAVNAAYFLAEQAAFGVRIYLDHLTSWKFANPFRFGRILDIEYVMTILRDIKPLDVNRVLASPAEFFIAITNAVSGESRMVNVKAEGIPLLKILNATIAIVPLFNESVEIEGQPYVDGGIANPIPIRAAIEAGCTHILALLTHPPEFGLLRFPWYQRLWIAPFLSKWSPPFIEVFHERQEWRYNASRDVALGRSIVNGDVQIAVICPGASAPAVGRATIARSKLLAATDDAIKRTITIFADLNSAPLINKR